MPLSTTCEPRRVSRKIPSVPIENDLSQLRLFVGEQVPVAGIGSALTTDQIISFVLHLREREYAPTTVARKIAAVKSFCHFLEQEGLIAEDPTQHIDSPRVTKYLTPRAASESEIERLLAQLVGDSPGRLARPRHAGVALCYSGCA